MVLLRSRIELLERIIKANGIDIDAYISQSTAANESSALDGLCETFDGVLTLDRSLNWDHDGELRFFGATSGRLEFQPSRQGKTMLA